MFETKRVNGRATEDNNLTPIDKLLEYAKPGQFSEAITEMWERWLTNEATDDATRDEREHMLLTYKSLMRFFNEI